MASAIIGSLRVILGLDTALFDKGLADAMKGLKGIGKSMQSAGKTMSAALTAPILGFGALTLKMAGDFEASMSRVGAATGATADQMQALETLARDLGKSTIFSASEASDAMEILAKNGLAVEQILGGATQASLDLAAATGSDMAGAADVATDVMLSFGKTTEEMGKVVDGITGTLLASKFGFDDYRLAIGQAGGVAGGLGVTFEDFNAALVATSNLFASGSDAGTSFKTFLTRLTPQSKGAAAAMKELGLEFFDAQGNMKSMEAIAGELRDGLSGLSDEATTAALQDIFGTDAMRTAIGLAGTTAERFREIQTALASASGAEQAAARLGPFNAAIEQLGGAFEELQLSIAKSGLIEFVTQMVGKLTEFVNYLAETNPELLKWGTVVAGVAAVLGPLVLTLGLVATGIAAIGAPVALVIAGLASLGAAIFVFRDEIVAVDQAIMNWARNFDAAFLAAFAAAKAQIAAFGATLAAFVSGAWAQFEAAWDGMVEKVHAVKDSIVQFATEIPGIFANLAAEMVTIGAQIIDGLWQGIQSKFAAVRDGISNFAGSIASSVKSTLGIQSPSRVFMEIGSFIMQGLGLGIQSEEGNVVAAATQVANASVAATKDAWAGLRDVTKDTADAFEGAFSRIGASIGEGLTGAKKWKDVLKDIIQQLAQIVFSNLGGGGAGGLGGIFQSLLGGLFGFAQGGSFKVGGAGGVDSQLVAFKASPNERVSVTKPGQERSGGILGLHIFIDEDGNWQHRVEEIASGAAQPVARRAANSAVGSYNYSQQHGGARANDHYFQRLKRRA